MRKLGYPVIGLFLLVFLMLPVGARGEGKGDAPVISATSAILVEASTGRVVYEKNADEVRPPASMTKMMTCILGLENMKVRSLITVSPRAAGAEDSAMGLQAGDRVDAQNLLLGMMLVSDNGAAVAVAEHINGTVGNFAERMNEKAKEIGCGDTHFANPNGLPDKAHVSTARDMAKIARYCLRNKEFRSIVGEKTASMRWEAPKGRFLGMENTNDLLGQYEGTTGIKTGWTVAAGGCLAASAKRKGVELIAIIMNSTDTESRFQDARKLLDYGFAHVRLHRGISKERMIRTIWVKDGREFRVEAGPTADVDYPLLHGEKPTKYSVEYDMPVLVTAPVKKGQKVGDVILKYEGKEIGRIDVVAKGEVPSGFSVLSYFFVGLLSHFIR